MNILIVGCESDIARDVIRILGYEKNKIITTTRNKQHLNKSNHYFDYLNTESYGQLIDLIKPQKLDAVLFFAGIQKGPTFKFNQLIEMDISKTQEMFMVNAFGPAILIEYLIESGVLNENAKLIVMSSRAGSTSERGRLKHHKSGGDVIYRASKAALNNLIKNSSFTHKNLNLTIVAMHPGWVRTKSGGLGADLEISESSNSIVKLLFSIDKNLNGTFMNYDGGIIEW